MLLWAIVLSNNSDNYKHRLRYLSVSHAAREKVRPAAVAVRQSRKEKLSSSSPVSGWVQLFPPILEVGVYQSNCELPPPFGSEFRNFSVCFKLNSIFYFVKYISFPVKLVMLVF